MLSTRFHSQPKIVHVPFRHLRSTRIATSSVAAFGLPASEAHAAARSSDVAARSVPSPHDVNLDAFGVSERNLVASNLRVPILLPPYFLTCPLSSLSIYPRHLCSRQQPGA